MTSEQPEAPLTGDRPVASLTPDMQECLDWSPSHIREKLMFIFEELLVHNQAREEAPAQAPGGAKEDEPSVAS